MKKLFVLGLSALLLCGCNVGGGATHSYSFKYPETTYGHAVWWTMHENRICEEPSIERSGLDDGSNGTLEIINVNLDLEDIGFLGINDYFSMIYADGYQSSMPADFVYADPNNWIDASPSTIPMHWIMEIEPYQGPYCVMYHKTFIIELTGYTKHSASNANHLMIHYSCAYRP